MAGEITLKELSPQLREYIKNAQGSGGSINVKYGSVTATEDNQTVFEIPIEDYVQQSCHLEIRINSTWIAPKFYTISGKSVTFTSGVVNGTMVHFTVYLLGSGGGTSGEIESLDASKIVESDEKQFVSKEQKDKIALIDTHVSDADIHITPEEREAWNKGGTPDLVTPTTDGLMSKEDKAKLDGIQANANNYIHPNDENTRHMTDAERAKLEGIEAGAKNIVLNNTVTSTSTTEAATANAVKVAYDKANHSHPYAATSHSHEYSRLPITFTNGSATLYYDSSVKKFKYDYFAKSGSVTQRKTYTIPNEDGGSSGGASGTQYSLSYLNGWQPNDVIGGYPEKEIVKIGDVVYVHASINGGSGSGYMATVPSACRPSTSMYVLASYSDYPDFKQAGIMVTEEGNLAIMDSFPDGTTVVLNFFYYIK